MANEYFSAIGSAFSDSVTGIIDDPTYTLYVNVTGDDISGQGTLAKPFKTPQRALFHLRDKFITQNGFAHIKMGAGRFVLSDAIEIRHPQGDRIGIKGQKPNLYNMKNCHGYTASHAAHRATDDVDFQTHGGTAPRYYRSSIRLDGVGQLDGSAQVPTISGLSGEYLLVQDYSMRFDDDYDHTAWDWNLNGKTAKRASLMGCNILYGTNIDVTDVKMNMKYYNFPYQLKTEFQIGRGANHPDNKTSIVRVGGCRNGHGGRDFPVLDDGMGGWLLPEDTDKYFSYSSDPLETTPETNENSDDGVFDIGDIAPAIVNAGVAYFGSTAEGFTTTNLENNIIPHYASLADTLSVGGDAIQKVFTQPRHDSIFITFNRMTATHVTTILEFIEKTKPGIILDGAQLGYINDIILEGKWQQFKQGFNHGGVTGENQALMDNHVGIFVRNGGNLSYDLGKTGAEVAKLKFSASSTIRNDNKPMFSDTVTISNVGINGFVVGSLVENSSYANLDDIVISNCDSGIVCNKNSQVSCERSTLIGFETSAIESTSSIIDAKKTMIAHVSLPKWNVSYAIASDTYYQRKTRDNTFLPGRQVVVNKTDDPGGGMYAGIVSSWGNMQSRYRQHGNWDRDASTSTMNRRHLTLYDHKGQLTTRDVDSSGSLGMEATPTLDLIMDHGITGASGDIIESGSHYEDSSYLKPFSSYSSPWGNGAAVISRQDSKINLNDSSVFYCFGDACEASQQASIIANNSVFAMNAGVGCHSMQGSTIICKLSRFFHNIDHSVETNNAMLNANGSCMEASRYSVYSTTGNCAVKLVDFREGSSMYTVCFVQSRKGSYVNADDSIYQAYHTDLPDNNFDLVEPKVRPNKLYNTITSAVDPNPQLYPDTFLSYTDATSHTIGL